MTFLDRLNLPEFDFMQNMSSDKIIKFLQSQELTSDFDSFWSIVQMFYFPNLKITIQIHSISAYPKMTLAG